MAHFITTQLDALIDKGARLISGDEYNQGSARLSFYFMILTMLLALAAIGLHLFWLAIPLILFNRLLMKIYERIVTHAQPRALILPNFLSIFANVFFYTGSLLAFTLGAPEFALATVIVLAAWLLSFAAIYAFDQSADAKNLRPEDRERKALLCFDGFTSEWETLSALLLICLLPQYYPALTVIYAIFILVITGGRLVLGVRLFKQD